MVLFIKCFLFLFFLLLLAKRELCTKVPFCNGEFKLNPIENKTYCVKDTSGKEREAIELDCVFPFKLNGEWKDTCIDDGTGKFICSIDNDYNGRFAVCQQECPLFARQILKYYESPAGDLHTMCLKPKPDVTAVMPDQAQQEQIINEHNRIRSEVSVPYPGSSIKNPPAADMTKVKWSDELARYSLRWAANMQFGHEVMHYRRLLRSHWEVTGQNGFSAYPSTYTKYKDTFWSDVIKSWESEKQYFVYEDPNYDNAKVGHYNMIITSSVAFVGCGLAYDNSSLYAYCNYLSNTVWRIPYKKSSTACSAFKPGSCQNNLGSCDKYCLNGGTLDLSTCTCQCLPIYTGNECEKYDCLKPDIEYNCTSNIPASFCTYSYYLYMCPNLCGSCYYEY